MVNVPPYTPSLGWYEEWFCLISAGKTDDEAIEGANRQCRVAGKDFARSSIGGSDNPMLLSVAIDGGSTRLKKSGAERFAKISGHGNWPHLHLGALEAVYGRAPYYQYIMPGIRRLLENVPSYLSEFNRQLHLYLSSFLQPDANIVMTDALKERREEMGKDIDKSLSIIDALMRFGLETNLLLISK